MPGSKTSRYTLCLAVAPWYRQECLEILKEDFGAELSIYAAEYSLDPTVRTGIDDRLYKKLSRAGLFRNKVLLTGIPLDALTAQCAVVDLNPRSLSAWAVILFRRLLCRRVVVWGHLYPRGGPHTKTAAIRRFMRRLANGTLTYGYDGAASAIREIPRQPVWVASNAIYRKSKMSSARALDAFPNGIIYVGRLESEKCVETLIPAFNGTSIAENGWHLHIVGSGSSARTLETQRCDSKYAGQIHMHGQVTNVTELRALYSASSLSLSPGYVGLNATQSLGFGVPMLYNMQADHSPEIELTRLGFMIPFRFANANAFAKEIDNAVDAVFSNRDNMNPDSISRTTAVYYSAESMASGIRAALTGDRRQAAALTWPPEDLVDG